MIIIKPEAFISDKGKNEENEDYIKYLSGKFYLVCDGVGGNGNGLIASKLLAESIYNLLSKSHNSSALIAVKEAEKLLQNYKKKYPNTERMSSTLALAQVIENTVLISWAGDSRVYQFRDGKIIYKTKDHTLVNEAVNNGVLSAVEALFHPDANELTKSIKGTRKPVTLDQILIEDKRENDYFLVCTDGIIESWIDSDLESLFSELKSSQCIINELNKNCKIFSNDNYSAIVFQLE
jgi:protein phosphatase